MINKKKIFFLSIFFILTIQILLYKNNNQKSSFRFFTWNIEKIETGRLINISFLSGLITSTLLNLTTKNDFQKTYKNTREEIDKNDEIIIEEKGEKSNFEMPPERDIRDTQPTISVNYRVIKDNKSNYPNNEQDSSKNPNYEDDWIKNDSDW